MNWFEKIVDGIASLFGRGGDGPGVGDAVGDAVDGIGDAVGNFGNPNYEGPLESGIDDFLDSGRGKDETPDLGWLDNSSGSGPFVDWARDYGVADPATWDSAKITITNSGTIDLEYSVEGVTRSAEYDDIHAFFDEVYDELYEDYEVDFDIEDEYLG